VSCNTEHQVGGAIIALYKVNLCWQIRDSGVSFKHGRATDFSAAEVQREGGSILIAKYLQISPAYPLAST